MTEETLKEQGYRQYRGNEVNVYFNTEICQHAGNCVRGNAEIFNLERKPWIQPDNAELAEVKRVINTCPSGALKYVEL